MSHDTSERPDRPPPKGAEGDATEILEAARAGRRVAGGSRGGLPDVPAGGASKACGIGGDEHRVKPLPPGRRRRRFGVDEPGPADTPRPTRMSRTRVCALS